MVASIKIRKWPSLIFSSFSMMFYFYNEDLGNPTEPRYYFGSLLFVWKIRHPDSDNILRFLSVCDSFLYSSYRFYPASDQVQEPLFFFKGTPFIRTARRALSGPWRVMRSIIWNVKRNQWKWIVWHLKMALVS